MTTPADLRRTLRNALPTRGLRPARPANLPTPPMPARSGRLRDPDWAIREIVDGAMFEPRRQDRF